MDNPQDPRTQKKSLFSEYASLITRGIKDVDKVIAGNWNKALDRFNVLDETKKAVASARLDKCLACPYNSINAKTSPEFFALYGGHYVTNRSDEDVHCSHCGCPLETKVLAMHEDCGLALYNIGYPENQQPLIWTAVP